MCTDPPYGVEYDPSWRNQAGAAKTRRTGKVLNDDRADWRETWSLFPGARHTVLGDALSMTTWFCDAYASWQKGAEILWVYHLTLCQMRNCRSRMIMLRLS